jgi:transcriptional regulator with XRE-family HTH domain
MTDVIQRRDLANFLRSHRETLDPARVGIPPGGRRRTPGLRREEVALLAGVSVTWYTWLEQARDINVSRSVLGSVARALRLDETETAYVFTLAGLPAPPKASTAPPVADDMLRRLTMTLDPNPAYVLTRWWDVLAYNHAYSALAGGLDDMPKAQRNVLWLMFTDAALRRLIVDWEDEASRLAAQLRRQIANYPKDSRGRLLADALTDSSEDFRRIWAMNSVAKFHTARKRMKHPKIGRIELDYVKLQSAGEDQQVVVFLPADESTTRKLASLT